MSWRKPVPRGVVALAAAAFVTLGADTVAAGIEEDRSLDLQPPTAEPGGLVIAEYGGCAAGEIVEFTLPGNPGQNVSCVDPDGDGRAFSRAVFPAPRTAGGYFVSAQILGVDGSQEDAGLTVAAPGARPRDDLADTGSRSGPAIALAASAVTLGVGLLGAARFRRVS